MIFILAIILSLIMIISSRCYCNYIVLNEMSNYGWRYSIITLQLRKSSKSLRTRNTHTLSFAHVLHIKQQLDARTTFNIGVALFYCLTTKKMLR